MSNFTQDNNKTDNEWHVRLRCPLCLEEKKNQDRIFKTKHHLSYHIGQHRVSKREIARLRHYLGVYCIMIQKGMIPQ